MIKFVNNWLSRHRNPMSFWLHMLGMPACFIVMPIMLFLQYWILAAVFFVAGYALQFIGHLVEGDRPGEVMLLRKIFGIGTKKDRNQAD